MQEIALVVLGYVDGYCYMLLYSRVRNLEYETTAMNDFMRSVKHCTQVLIVGAHHCVDWSCKFANSDVMKIFRFRSNFGHETLQGSHVSLSCS